MDFLPCSSFPRAKATTKPSILMNNLRLLKRPTTRMHRSWTNSTASLICPPCRLQSRPRQTNTHREASWADFVKTELLLINSILFMANSGSNIPGYQGHVPLRAEFPGKTVCAGNRDAELAFRRSNMFGRKALKVIAEIQEGAAVHRTSAVQPCVETETSKSLGNHSRLAKSWIQGP